MKTKLCIFVMSLAATFVTSAAPRLVVSTPSLTPESQIDLVFDLPVVPTTELGKTVDNTWLEIEPAIPGKLLWKAQNIAQFIPAQVLNISTNYQFSIPNGLKHLDQSPIPAKDIDTLETDEFKIITAISPNRHSEEYVPATGQWLIAFNDAVDPAAAAGFISFGSKQGHRVAAKLERATIASASYLSNYKPWSERFPNTNAPAKTPESITPNIIIATPISPLPVGDEWSISLLAGLPNTSNTARTKSDSNYNIGKIEPFKILKIDPVVQVNQPRKIALSFNQPVPDPLPADLIEKCLTISPSLEGVTATVNGSQIYLSGDFTKTDDYIVDFHSTFQSKAGLKLNNVLRQEIKFKHLDPELTLPSQSEAQLANGKRTYRIQTVNLTKLNVRIKKLAGNDLIRAYQGYRNYTGSGHNGKEITPTAPLPYSLLNGETVFVKSIELGNPIDTSKEITLNWDEILPAQLRNTAIFIDVTGDYNGKEGQHNAQALLQLTDIGLAWKVTPEQAFIYAFSCDTGAPLPSVKLQFIGEDSATLPSITTDTSGIATIPRTDSIRHLHASLGNDSYLTAFDSTIDTVNLWRFPVHYSSGSANIPTRKAFLFTDRSLYRPGETVRLKGIVRNQLGNIIEAAESKPAQIKFLDPAGNEVHSSEVTFSSTGSFDLTYKLPPESTGVFRIRLEYPEEIEAADAIQDDWQKQEEMLGNALFSLSIQVEEFRRNAFEIEQTIAQPAPGASSISINLLAKYYQGQPVAAGAVNHFSRISSKNPYPERFRDFLFGNHRADDWGYWYHYFGYSARGDDGEGGDDGGYSSGPSTNVEGQEILSADGTATLAISIPQSEFPTTQQVEVSSEVTDANNQTLTATTKTTVHPASVYIGISRNDKLVRVNEALPLKIVATDTEGNPFPGSIKVTATLTREVNSAVKTINRSGETATRNDVTEETVSTSEITIDPAASAAQGMDFSVTPTATGLHYLTIRGTDPEGRSFATVNRFHAYGTDEYPWLYEDGMRIKLIAEKKSYKPGETARLLVLSPIEGTALVTIEREKVLRSFLVPLKAEKPIIDIPLSDEDAPNAFVSVLIVKGTKESARDHKEPQLRLGYCELIVENQRDGLAIKMETNEPSVRPGDTVTLTGNITLADGQPAAGAEVTFYAEDEGTLAVMGYKTPEPMSYFYKPRDLKVESGTSFHSFISEDPESQDFYNKGFFIGGGGEEMEMNNPIRNNFDPCATWVPTLIADANGKFTHSFKTPDTLTRYRLIAVAHHSSSRFGHAESSLVVKKDLMLEPKTPRFANQGDTFNAQVLVQNASEYTGTWEIKYSTANGKETPAATPLGSTTETVTLAPGKSSVIIFPTRADTTGEAALTWRATPVSLSSGNLTPRLSHHLSDAVESRFEVQYPMPLLRQSKLVSLSTPNTKQNLLDQLDEKLLTGTGDIELEFASSPLVEASGAIDSLLSYPYGCVEQTTSSLIPWLAVEDLSPVVPRFAKIQQEKVAETIQAGVNRLLSMQLPDGSFAYWPGGTESVPWATSYAGMGLIIAKEKGANIPEYAIENLSKNLIESLRGLANEKSASALEIHARSLLVLSLAGSPQPAYLNALADRLKELTPSARSLLATAIATMEDADDQKIAFAKSILTSQVPCKNKDDSWMPYSAESAYQLIAWLAIEPEGPQATQILDRMLRERNPYGAWNTTWVNGWSLIAMSDYAKQQSLNDEPVTLTFDSSTGTEAISLSKEAPTATRSFKLTPDLQLAISSDRNACVRIKVSSKPQIVPMQPVAKNGLSVDRIYERVNGDGSTETLTEPKVGDLIRVSLRVTLPKDNTKYLVIDDPLPATFETVNNDFESQRAAAAINTSEDDWNISHSELRNDRAVFFLDEIWRKGTYTITYLARCTLSGQAVAPPAKVESMYDPENFALSASRIFSGQ